MPTSSIQRWLCLFAQCLTVAGWLVLVGPFTAVSPVGVVQLPRELELLWGKQQQVVSAGGGHVSNVGGAGPCNVGVVRQAEVGTEAEAWSKTSPFLSPYQKIPRWSPEDIPVIPAHEESGIIPNTSEIYTIFNSVRLLQAQHDLHVIYQILMNFCKVLPGHIKSWDEI